MIVASNTVKIGIHVAQGDFRQALEVPEPTESASVPPNVVAEFTAHRALAQACSGNPVDALNAALEAQSLSATSEAQVLSRLAIAVSALEDNDKNEKLDRSLDEALLAVHETGHVDAFVTAYRGCPALLSRAVMSDTFGSALVAIVMRANDIELTRRTLPTLAMPNVSSKQLLSQRETQVLRLVAQGLRNRDIAERLFISEVTVKAHMRSIMRKLGARSRTHAVALADFGD